MAHEGARPAPCDCSREGTRVRGVRSDAWRMGTAAAMSSCRATPIAAGGAESGQQRPLSAAVLQRVAAARWGEEDRVRNPEGKR